MQYTIRAVPKAVDKALRARAKAEGKSLNQVAVELLEEAVGLGDTQKPRRDLSDIAGRMMAKDASIVERSVRQMDETDIRSQRTALKKPARGAA